MPAPALTKPQRRTTAEKAVARALQLETRGQLVEALRAWQLLQSRAFRREFPGEPMERGHGPSFPAAATTRMLFFTVR